MKYILLLLPLLSFAQDKTLSTGKATYHVKYVTKRIEATSKAVKSKIACTGETCEYLLAVPVKTFESGDSNRDLNTLETVEASKFPIAKAHVVLRRNCYLKIASL